MRTRGVIIHIRSTALGRADAEAFKHATDLMALELFGPRRSCKTNCIARTSLLWPGGIPSKPISRNALLQSRLGVREGSASTSTTLILRTGWSDKSLLPPPGRVALLAYWEC